MANPGDTDPVKCAKCGHRNPPGADVCAHCAAHLYLECPHCAHRSLRTRRACPECGKSLRQGWLKKLKRWTFSRHRKHALILTGLTIALVCFLCWIVFAIADYRFFDWR